MKVIGVHGFTYDPASESTSPAPLYVDWAEMLESEISGFAWYSSPPGLTHLFRAWSAYEWNRYRYAYRELAVTAAVDLAGKIVEASEPVSIVCHSLGSRVAIKAVAMLSDPSRVQRILILDGAELQPAVTPLPLPLVLNVCNARDNVLKELGSRFAGVEAPCIGQAGLGSQRARWRDIFIDDPATQKRALDKRGWNLEGHASLDLGDHCTSYRHKGNWPLYRAFLAGDRLDDFNFIRRASAAGATK